MKTALLPVILVLGLLGASIAPCADDITNGMSRAEVIELIGQPRGAMTKGGDQILLYAKGTVTLREGMVVTWDVSLSRPHEEPKPVVVPAKLAPQPPAPSPTQPSAAATEGAKDGDWETNLLRASAEAVQSHRYLLLDFTGSDWCHFCIQLEKEVFSTPEFKTFAASKFVCVKLDFPRNLPQSAALKKQNADLQKSYAVRGFPTIVILTPTGEQVGSQSGYGGGGPQPYIEKLKTMLAEYEKKPPAK